MSAIHLRDRLSEAGEHLDIALVLATGRGDSLGASIAALVESAAMLLRSASALAERPAVEESLARLDIIDTRSWLAEAAAQQAEALPF